MKTLSWMTALCLLFPSLNAEIEEITITWNALKCQSGCVNDIKKNLERTPGVIHSEVDPSGFAKMRWDPNTPFSYEPFRYASAAVGIHIRSMRVRVKGKIVQEGREMFLISDKDNSRFYLIGPLKVEIGGYSPSNISSHPLPQSTIDPLIEAIRVHATIIIEGPLLLPSHYTRALIVEHMTKENRK